MKGPISVPLFVSSFVLFTITANAENFDSQTSHILKLLEPKVATSVPALIRRNGFPVEEYSIKTSDGYILKLFRIPYGRSGPQETKKVVFLQHGNFADGASWVINDAEKALAYRLADLGGVDVWIGNNRGTRYSMQHERLTPKDFAFWNFTSHEIGMYDLPAAYDFIFEKTKGNPEFYVIVHSMGGMEFIISMITHPQYIPKVKGFIGLSPAVFGGNTSNIVLRSMSKVVRIQQAVHDALLIGPMVPIQILPFMSYVGNICSPRIAVPWICFAFVDAIVGLDPTEANYNVTTEVVSKILSSTSSKKVFHALQLMSTDKFQYYNYYGRNMEMYGQPEPPIYDISGMIVPTVLYASTYDNVVTKENVMMLAAHLPNVKEFNLVEKPKFNHFDFLFSKNINQLVHDRIIEILQNSFVFEK